MCGTLVYTHMCGTQFIAAICGTLVYTITVKALINAQAFIRIITYHRERGGRLLEAS